MSLKILYSDNCFNASVRRLTGAARYDGSAMYFLYLA